MADDAAKLAICGRMFTSTEAMTELERLAAITREAYQRKIIYPNDKKLQAAYQKADRAEEDFDHAFVEAVARV